MISYKLMLVRIAIYIYYMPHLLLNDDFLSATAATSTTVFFKLLEMIGKENKIIVRRFQGLRAAREIEKTGVRHEEIRLWQHREGIVCYVLYANDEPASFVLLSDLNDLVVESNPNPYMADFVYTINGYRRLGYASRLIEIIEMAQSRYEK